ncbi:MAG: tetratricopeptide repeat protein [Rhodothermales bacterium]|nr:tetratricopeptide repeat protein [Rhodothermales bacterium]
MNKAQTKIVTGATPLKRKVFVVMMLLLPILFFALLEVGLRLAGYGEHYPLFEPVPGYASYKRPNEDVARRYFASIEKVPGIPFDSFRAVKDSNTFRIFVQGGSTAAGFPFYFSGSFPDMLEQRLLQSFPGRNIEVVNTAMAAVGSYTLADLADEIIAEEPDLVLIYAGHNEYYGALGVGSSESLGRSPVVVRAYLKLQNLRLVQGLRSLLSSAAAAFQGRERGQRPGATLMERMVGRQRIPYDSRIFRDGLRQFRYNLGDILERYRDAGIPVLIGTVASNVRDQPPFISRPAAATDIKRWQARLASTRDQIARGDSSAALRSLEEMIRTDSLAADPFYLIGRLYDGRKQFAAARRAYVMAKDRDELRFRAPEAINRIIRETASRFGATVVETEQALAAVSAGGIPGSDVMTEHLHPNIDGYFNIADSFYDALRSGRFVGEWAGAISRETARRELLVTPIDSIAGLYRIQSLMSSWPFRPAGAAPLPLDTIAASTEEGRLALRVFEREMRQLDALDELQKHYTRNGNYVGALKALLSIIQRYPFLPNPYLAAANIMIAQGRYQEAIEYCEASLDRLDSADGRRMLGSLLVQAGRNAEAIPHLERSVQIEPSSLQALYNLAGAYALTGQFVRARETGARVLELYPGHQDTRRLLASLPGS